MVEEVDFMHGKLVSDTIYMGPTLISWARHRFHGPDTDFVGPSLVSWARHWFRGPRPIKVVTGPYNQCRKLAGISFELRPI